MATGGSSTQVADTSQGGAAVQHPERRHSIELSRPDLAETSEGGAAVQDPESAKELGAEKEKPVKRMPSGTAEQIEMYEKREEELKQQHRTESEKMELCFREQLGKLEQEINDYKTGGTLERGDSKESSPQAMAVTSDGSAAVQDQDSVKEMGAENEESKKRMLSGTAEQIEMYEKIVEELKQQHRTESEKMELDFKEELGKLKREINDYKTMKRGDSIKSSPQAMAETSQGGAAVQHLTLNEPFWVVMMAFSGALVGAIVGATDGVQGSAAGVIFGSTIGVLMAILYIRATRVL